MSGWAFHGRDVSGEAGHIPDAGSEPEWLAQNTVAGYNVNPELPAGETPLHERLADAAKNVADATERLVAISEPCKECGRVTTTPVTDARSATIDLSRAVSKLLTILWEEAQRHMPPLED